MSTPSNVYLRTAVMTAGPGELRLMLFDGAIRFTEQAREALVVKNYERMYNSVTRAQDIVLELINSLRPEQDPDLCEKLSALYTFIYQRLVTASTQRDADMLDEALQLLRYERETWSMLLQKLASENARATELGVAPEETPVLPPAGDVASRQLVGGRVSVKG